MKTIVGVMALAAVVSVGQQPLIQAAGPDEVPFSQIEVGMDSPIKVSGVQVITDPQHWKTFVTKLNDENLKKPKIDWDKFQVVIATLEGSSKDGLALQLERLHKTKNGVDIEFQLSKNNGGSSGFSDFANSHNTLGKSLFPYAIIQTPKLDTKWHIKVLD